MTGVYNPDAFNGSIWQVNYCQNKRCPSQSECQKSVDLGDMKLVKDQYYFTAKTGESAFVSKHAKPWNFTFDGSKYMVPYQIDKKIRNNHRGKMALQQAFEKLASNSSLKFIEQTTEESYLYFTHGVGCHSLIGQQKKSGPQDITLGDGCLFYYTIIHEVELINILNKALKFKV